MSTIKPQPEPPAADVGNIKNGIQAASIISVPREAPFNKWAVALGQTICDVIVGGSVTWFLLWTGAAVLPAVTVGGLTLAQVLYWVDADASLARCKTKFVSAQELLSSGHTNLRVGDMVQFQRTLYQHWGVYVGLGRIVHLLNSGIVTLETLTKVAGTDKCRVNNLEAEARYHGLEARARKQIEAYSMRMVNTRRPYNLASNNCDHFVTECFYGTGFSWQETILDCHIFTKLTAELLHKVSDSQ